MSEAKAASDKIHDLLKETTNPAARQLLLTHAGHYLKLAAGDTSDAAANSICFEYEDWEKTMLQAIADGADRFLARPQSQAEAQLCLIHRQYKHDSFRQ